MAQVTPAAPCAVSSGRLWGTGGFKQSCHFPPVFLGTHWLCLCQRPWDPRSRDTNQSLREALCLGWHRGELVPAGTGHRGDSLPFLGRAQGCSGGRSGVLSVAAPVPFPSPGAAGLWSATRGRALLGVGVACRELARGRTRDHKRVGTRGAPVGVGCARVWALRGPEWSGRGPWRRTLAPAELTGVPLPSRAWASASLARETLRTSSSR